MTEDRGQRGFALVAVMMLAAMIAALLGAYYLLTRVELATTRSSMSATRGFYAAEAGLNIRAEEIRAEFLGYNRPSGTAPVEVAGQLPCRGGDPGSGDLICKSFSFQDRDVLTFVSDDLDDDEGPDDPAQIIIPPGEPFQGLNAQEYTYAVSSAAVESGNLPEALLDMHFKSRLVPLFQFAVFYDKDLEILPGPPMSLAGPVHTNGNLFAQADAGGSLTIDGQVTVAGRMFHGRKGNGFCDVGTLTVHDLSGPLDFPPCGGALRREIVADDVDGTNPPNLDWQGMVRIGLPPVEVPSPDTLDPLPGKIFWDKADLRILLHLTGALRPIKVHRPDGSIHNGLTNQLASRCGDAVWWTSGSVYNFREGSFIEMLDVDVLKLMDCIETEVTGLMDGRDLDDATEGGLVWYFGVDNGVNAAAPNNYGVRIRGGERLAPSSGATDVAGLTVVSNQALYVQGDFNRDPGADWRPAAFIGDSINVLSGNWDDARSTLSRSLRPAIDTTIRAAFLAGTDTTGGPAGEGRLDNPGNYNGGLENFPRFHENWQPGGGVRTFTYRGSFVSLNRPIRVNGPHGAQSYRPPARDWGYETRFNDAANLPPLTPRFVYLKQELFVRQFDY